MKLSLLLLFCLPLGAFAQNWLPVVPGEIQHYRLPDSNHITHSLRIDSTRQFGNNTIFYLNRIIRWKNIGELVALKDQGQFLGQTMTLTANGQLILEHQSFFLDTTIVLQPFAGMGQSWLAVQQSNTQATVSNLEETQILGVTDSVKTITFSNGAVWRLSKHHGLVEAPDYLNQHAPVILTGLETAGLGDRLYRMSDFFDYQVGDVLQFGSYSNALSGGTTESCKLTFLEKQVNNAADSFIYTVEKRSVKKVFGMFNYTEFKIDTIALKYFKQDWLRMTNHHGQLLSVPWEGYSYATFFNQGIILGKKQLFGAPDNDTCAVYQVSVDLDNWLTFIDGGIECKSEERYYEVFRKQLGRTNFSYSYIDNSGGETLTGAIIQGDTIFGTIKPDWVYTQTNAPSNNVTLQPQPNPTTNTTSIPLPEGWNDGEVWVYHLSGSLERRQKVDRTDRINLDLSDLPDGLYLIKYQSKQGILTGKVLKM
ncbi:MAG TPA: T9SS type A sorting domain-containing protein [Saprospiraceae bacterium]|nr:T9SS type A sorting domain-containing protein [Saprospiraceae bacterium]